MERYHFLASSGRQFGLNYKSLSELSRDEVESEGAVLAILKVLKRVHQSFCNSDNEDNLMGTDPNSSNIMVVVVRLAQRPNLYKHQFGGKCQPVEITQESSSSDSSDSSDSDSELMEQFTFQAQQTALMCLYAK
ncbi:hypothetical protein GIB67_000731 [Kingdonia uniflora]|uniref:Uncharacterized protein n=1 Tax=Kingdonia uniflora TaxID=39325 RepID=A0A7J7NDC5_9MAGN|nr:hypothetical protein GIB67_000731 [Kingdonia uniflora]